MTDTDHAAQLAAFCEQWLKYNEGGEVIDHGFGPDHGGELTTTKLRAALDELERLRAERATADAVERQRLREHVELNLWRANRTPEEVAWMADVAEGAVELIAAQAESAPQQPERGGICATHSKPHRLGGILGPCVKGPGHGDEWHRDASGATWKSEEEQR